MAPTLDHILAELAKALELERELGVRTVEIDRALLDAPKASAPPPRTSSPPVVRPAPAAPRPVTARPAVVRPSASGSAEAKELVFLHDRPLSAEGAAMVAKIVQALGRTEANTPVVVAPPAPRARVVVVLGGRAMKLYYPEMRGGPGQWLKSPEGDDVLITYSPEYILRFGMVTPAVLKLKQEMWRSLKAVAQRLR